MKKYLLLILLFLLPLLGQTAELKIDETKSDIYFVNGILTERSKANASLYLIWKKTADEQYDWNIIKMEKAP